MDAHMNLFHALADPARLRIVETMRSGECAVGDIVEREGVPAVRPPQRRRPASARGCRRRAARPAARDGRRRRAVRTAGVMREADAGRRDPVEVRRLEIRLAVAAQIARREVVALDKNDAGQTRFHRAGVGLNVGEQRRQIGVRGRRDGQRGEQKESAVKFHL
jgi:DNA-binding transcriptional ArsR family regulator